MTHLETTAAGCEAASQPLPHVVLRELRELVACGDLSLGLHRNSAQDWKPGIKVGDGHAVGIGLAALVFAGLQAIPLVGPLFGGVAALLAGAAATASVLKLITSATKSTKTILEKRLAETRDTFGQHKATIRKNLALM